MHKVDYKYSASVPKQIDYTMVQSICRSIVKGEPEENVLDFVQDVCVKLLEKQSQFKGKSSWKTWVYSIANNLWISKKRHLAVEQCYISRARHSPVRDA